MYIFSLINCSECLPSGHKFIETWCNDIWAFTVTYRLPMGVPLTAVQDTYLYLYLLSVNIVCTVCSRWGLGTASAK